MSTVEPAGQTQEPRTDDLRPMTSMQVRQRSPGSMVGRQCSVSPRSELGSLEPTSVSHSGSDV